MRRWKDHTPSLVEQTQSQWESVHGQPPCKGRPQWLWGPSMGHWQKWHSGCPIALHEALGWWDAPPWLSSLHSMDFMLHTDASGPRNFWAMRQEKILALAQVLQACAKKLEVPPGILYNSVWELQECIGPLMTLSGTLLRLPSWNPAKKSMDPPPLWRRKLSSWVRNLRPHPSQNTQRSLNHQSPQSRLMLSPLDPLTLEILNFFLCLDGQNGPYFLFFFSWKSALFPSNSYIFAFTATPTF